MGQLDSSCTAPHRGLLLLQVLLLLLLVLLQVKGHGVAVQDAFESKRLETGFSLERFKGCANQALSSAMGQLHSTCIRTAPPWLRSAAAAERTVVAAAAAAGVKKERG
jgi:hypothetical protein